MWDPRDIDDGRDRDDERADRSRGGRVGEDARAPDEASPEPVTLSSAVSICLEVRSANWFVCANGHTS